MSAKEKAREDSTGVSVQQQVGVGPRFNKYALRVAVLASMTSILLGYDIGVMSGAVLFIRDDLGITWTQEELLIGSLNVCSLLGSLSAGTVSDRIGRRYTIVLSSATFLIGALLMSLAPSFSFLMAGRVVAGIGVGFSLMIGPVYTAELSPTLTRGLLTSLPEVFINVGILLGYIFNYALAGLPVSLSWRLMLGVAAFPAAAVGIGVLALPESPRWLVMQGQRREAKWVLLKTADNQGEAELRLVEIEAAAAAATRASAGSDDEKSGKGVWMELLWRPTPAVRRMLAVAVGLNFFMQASGNDAVVYYSPEVFRAAGIQRKKAMVAVTIVMGFTKTCFVLLSACFLDSFGRRPLLLVGSTGKAVALAALGISSKILEAAAAAEEKPTWALTLCVVAVCADVSFFSIGLGPITWVYSSEIFPTRLRAQGSSIAVGVNRIVSGVVTMTFLSLAREISFGYVFFIFAGISAAGAVFFYLFLPETKGKSLEETGILFEDERHEPLLRSPGKA
ncbi:hypothetical protein ACLOJK_020224 [Asimina triloba]